MMEKIIFSENSFKDIKENILKNSGVISINFFNAVDIFSFKKIPEFRACLKNKNIKNINNIDGISVAIPLSIINLKKVRRLQGPTFTDKFLKDKELNEGKKHFFIGVEQGNIEKVLERYPNLKNGKIKGHNLPYVKGLFFPGNEIKILANKINHFNPDYLWIGMGSPKQQILTNQIFDKIKVKKFFNVGVAMEFIKGSRKRAPEIFQKTGLEWLYRLFDDFKLIRNRTPRIIFGTFLSFFIAKLKNKEFE